MSLSVTRYALYLQVSAILAERISAGHWKPGELLPNEQDLAREFSVSPGTMRKALDKLTADRMVERRQGRGTFVLDHAKDDRAFRFGSFKDEKGQRLLPTSTEVLEQCISAPTEIERERLNLDPAEKVLRTRRVRESHGRPFMYEEASLVTGRLPGLTPEELVVGDYLIAPLAQKYGAHLVRGAEKLACVPASSEVAKLLAVQPGTGLLRLDRLVYSMSGQSVEWRVAWCALNGKYYYVAQMS